MKVLISADMEGVTGVTCPDDCEPGHSRWERCRRLLTGDVNAAVAGFVEAGADEVVVNEAHADMRNLLIDQLDPRATLLIGTHKPLGMMEGIDRSPTWSPSSDTTLRPVSRVCWHTRTCRTRSPRSRSTGQRHQRVG